jgi:hypothetical protein
VKQLEAAGLIEVAATRMVSGIPEQRYRARQRSLQLSAALLRRHADERGGYPIRLRCLPDRRLRPSKNP